jgi:hypothetical protein
LQGFFCLAFKTPESVISFKFVVAHCQHGILDDYAPDIPYKVQHQILVFNCFSKEYRLLSYNFLLKAATKQACCFP